MPGVINKVFSFISGDNEDGTDKDVLLRQIAREISQNKYAKFYRVKQSEVDPALGQYFYNLYRSIYPLQVFLSDPVMEAKIKRVTLESFLDKNTLAIIKRLTPEAIAERKKNAGAELSKQLEADLSSLIGGFDSPRINTADKCYNLIASMKSFVFFDFYSLLGKFDPDIKKGDFLSVPKLAAVEGEIIMPDIADFMSILPPFSPGDDWKIVFEILKYCKGGTDIIPLAQWNAILLSINDIKQSNILDLIGKLVNNNPIWESKSVIPDETLSGSWLEEKRGEVRGIINEINGNQRDAQINALEKEIFGLVETVRLHFYTREKGRVLEDKELESYTYAPALNHLLVFIQDFISKELHELCDILLIRGQWTNNSSSRQMSDGFHDVMEIEGEIKNLDETLDDDGNDGTRLRAALLRVDRDKTQARYIKSIISGVNEEALNMINRATPSLIVVGKHLKLLMEDCEKKPFELIMNWKELAQFSKVLLSQRITAAYKKINYFVQLMALETHPLEE